MRIAIVFDGLSIGGIERVGADYVRLLMELGHEITIINLNPNCVEMLREYPPGYSYGEIRFLHRLAPERYAQLIKLHSVGRYLYPCCYVGISLIDVFYKMFCRSLSFLKVRYDLAIAFSGHYNDLTFVANNFVKAKHKMAWLHGNILSYIIISDGFISLYRKIKNLIVLNEDYQSDVLLRNSQMKVKIHKLYNPSSISERIIDTSFVQKLQTKYGRFMMMVGRIDADKDQMTLIRALEYIKDKYGFLEKLLLIGDGHMRLKLEKYVNENGLSDQILFLGNQYDVQNYFRAAYLFVHSSPAEGLPTTLIEAILLGLPIVSTNSMPGVGEVLGDGKYGAIVPVGDWKQLGEVIYKIYQDVDMYMKYQRCSHERSKDFMPETIKHNLKKILEDL